MRNDKEYMKDYTKTSKKVMKEINSSKYTQPISTLR